MNNDEAASDDNYSNTEIQWLDNLGAKLISSCKIEIGGSVVAHHINVEGKLMTCLGCSECFPGMSNECEALSKELAGNRNGYLQNSSLEEESSEERKRKFSQTFTKKSKHKFKSPKKQ